MARKNGPVSRAYSVLEIKALDDEQRIIEGIASTPSPDRMGDIVEPMGAKFKLPMPLLWQHNHSQPIGTVEFAKPTKSGIPFRARLAKIDEPGLLKDRIDLAWQSIKAGLVRAVSIGFQALEYSRMENGGYRFLEWEWLELSAVTIPANADATITTIRSIDEQLRAASGRNAPARRRRLPGASGSRNTNNGDPAMKTIAEQIAEIEARRAEIGAEMKEFGDVAQLDAEQAADYDELAKEFEETEAPYRRLKQLQAAMGTAKPARGADRREAGESRRSVPAAPKMELAKGLQFARYAMAIAAGKGSISDSLEYAKRWGEQGKTIATHIKATAGTVEPTSPGWGSELAQPNTLTSEFIELLMPATVIGRIAGFDMVPFNVRILEQTGGSTVGWVGELQPKGVGELAFDEFLLGFHKIAGIVVISEELVRLSTPSAEEKVRNDLVKQVSKFMDVQFLNPTITATSARPASVTNGVAAVSASGTDAEAFRYDLNQTLAPIDAAEIDPSSIHIVMNGTLARGLSSLRNPLGVKEFPELTAKGGEIEGFPAIVSNNSPSGQITIVVPNEVAMGDDGTVRLDASNQATLDMAGGASPNFSLWQRNAIGIRAERGVTWKKKRAAAAQLITGAAYGPSDTSP